MKKLLKKQYRLGTTTYYNSVKKEFTVNNQKVFRNIKLNDIRELLSTFLIQLREEYLYIDLSGNFKSDVRKLNSLVNFYSKIEKNKFNLYTIDDQYNILIPNKQDTTRFYFSTLPYKIKRKFMNYINNNNLYVIFNQVVTEQEFTELKFLVEEYRNCQEKQDYTQFKQGILNNFKHYHTQRIPFTCYVDEDSMLKDLNYFLHFINYDYYLQLLVKYELDREFHKILYLYGIASIFTIEKLFETGYRV